nr:EOG090X0DMT [Moina brachiata]
MDLVDANEGPAESDHPLNTSPERPALNGAGGGPGSSGHNHSQSSAISIVQVTLPQAQVQSVIQPTSVIQSTPSLQATSLAKGNIILVSKPNSVIHTTGGSSGTGVPIQTLQVIDNSGLHEDENTKKRREILARRPSYRKILNELGGCEISGKSLFMRFACADFLFSLFSFYRSWPFRLADKKQLDRLVMRCDSFNRPVLPSGTIQLAAAAGNQSQAVADAGQTLPTLTMTNTPGGGAIVQYAQGQDGQFFVPVCVTGDLQAYALRPVTTTAGLNTGVVVGSSAAQSLQNSKHLAEEASRNHDMRIMKANSGNHSDEWDPSEPTIQKRELRLLKNREAARECRRKKKEYIKCLENRVAVLENQNKALIEELKSLKELYCSQKSD